MVTRLTLDFSSGHDLTARDSDLTARVSEPRVGLCADSPELAWDSLSPSLSAPSPLECTHSLSFTLSQNKQNKTKQETPMKFAAVTDPSFHE